MKKIKQFTFVLFILSALALSYPVSKGQAQIDIDPSKSKQPTGTKVTDVTEAPFTCMATMTLVIDNTTSSGYRCVDTWMYNKMNHLEPEPVQRLRGNHESRESKSSVLAPKDAAKRKQKNAD